MYPGRQPTNVPSSEGEDEQEHGQGQIPTQYTPSIDVQDWNAAQLYYHQNYMGHPAQNYPAESNYGENIAWMDPFEGAPSDLHEQESGATIQTSPQYQGNLSRTASSSTGGRETRGLPYLPSQGNLEPEEQSPSSSRHSSLAPEGQPGSSTGAAGTVRRQSSRYSSRPRLEEENRLLLDLRDRQRLPWRQVTQRFEQTYGREYRMPTLQMRYGRLRNASQASRQRQWTDADTEALRRAWQWYMDERWRIIADRMQHFGAREQWTPEECETAWRQLNGEETSGD